MSKYIGLSSDLPSLSSTMGFVPFDTPQTFSRMVVLPALARPMTRMRKCGHLYRSRRISMSTSESTTSLILLELRHYFDLLDACITTQWRMIKGGNRV